MKENKDFLDFPKGGQNTLWSTKAESLHAVLRKSVILTEIKPCLGKGKVGINTSVISNKRKKKGKNLTT